MPHPIGLSILLVLAGLGVLWSLRQLLQRFNLRTVFALPADGTYAGIHQPEPGGYPPHPTRVYFSQTSSKRRPPENRLLRLSRITAGLAQVHDVERLYEAMLAGAEELLQAEQSGLCLLAEDGLTIQAIKAHNLTPEQEQALQSEFSGRPLEQVFQDYQPIRLEDLAQAAASSEALRRLADYGVCSLLALPVFSREQKAGVLAVFYRRPHHFTEQELQSGETLASGFAMALQNTRLYQAEHNQRAMAEALTRATIALSSSLNLEEVLDTVLEQTSRVVACKSLNVMLIEGEVAQVVRRKVYESPARGPLRENEHAFPLSTPTIHHMLSTGQPLLISDTRHNDLWTAVNGTEWIRSHAAAPMKIGEQIIGFLNVDSDEPDYFDPEAPARLQAFASQAALAIRNARLYLRTQAYAAELEGRVRSRTAELQAAKERIEGILASVPDAVFVLDEAGKLVQANQAGESLLAAARLQQVDLFAGLQGLTLESGAAPSEKTIIEVQERAYQPLASPLTISGQPDHLVLVLRDVTRFRELDRLKNQFVSDVSHELRTPLTNLTIYLELLANTDDPVKKEKHLETLSRETRRLASLIDDLLTISRLESGRVEVNPTPVQLNRLVKELAFDRSMMAEGHQLDLKCEMMENLPEALGDERFLSQALSNLLTNAINYTPPGGTVGLKTAFVQSSEGESWVVVEVSDDGAGIPPEETEHIFERFYRGSAGKMAKAAGTGLGLPISKEIVERMGGKITVQSTPGKGSTFTVWLRAVL